MDDNDFVWAIALVLCLLIIAGSIVTGVTIYNNQQTELAKACVQSGGSWVTADRNMSTKDCVRK